MIIATMSTQAPTLPQTQTFSSSSRIKHQSTTLLMSTATARRRTRSSGDNFTWIHTTSRRRSILTSAAADSPPPPDKVVDDGKRESTDLPTLWRRFWEVAAPYWYSDDQMQAGLQLGAVFALTLATTGISVGFSFLGRDFYDALANKDQEQFTKQLLYYLGAFAGGISVWMVVGPLNCLLGMAASRQGKEKSVIEPERKESKVANTRSIAKDNVTVSNSQIAQQRCPPPLVSALKSSAKQNVASFHFPGHNRGRAAPSSLTELIGTRPFLHDLPELPELDNLFCPEGPILEAQRAAAKLFGSSETWFLVGGTTCGIQAAIMATCSPGDTLILPRNSHLSAISAMVLTGAVPNYITPEYNSEWDIAGGISPSQVEKAIKDLEEEGRKASAVFVTSPTYHGICSNLRELSGLCHSYGIPLIVDEAHGAHLGFHPQMPNSAIQQGADLAVQSTHKVLCSLTQSSMLHMSGDIVDRDMIARCLQTLQSTSPSYLLLASLDATRAQISENPETIFNKSMDLAVKAKKLIRKIPGISVVDYSTFSNFPNVDPLRLTIGFWQLGLSGYEADDILDKDHQIISELVGTRSVTFAINLGTCREDIQRLLYGMKSLSATCLLKEGRKHRLGDNDYEPFADVKMSLNPRDAFFASKTRVSISDSLGRICGELICPYPPGIPVMIPGEVITETALAYLLHVKNKGALITGASDPLLSSIVVCKR